MAPAGRGAERQQAVHKGLGCQDWGLSTLGPLGPHPQMPQQWREDGEQGGGAARLLSVFLPLGAEGTSRRMWLEPSVSCLISPPCPGSRLGPPSLPRALPREELTEEENHFSRLAHWARVFLPHPLSSQWPQEMRSWGPARLEPLHPFRALRLQAQGLRPVSALQAKSLENGRLLAPKATTAKEGLAAQLLCICQFCPGSQAGKQSLSSC